MGKKIKIGILTEAFVDWPGGIEFLKYVVLGLTDNNYEMTILVLNRNTVKLKIRNFIKKIYNTIFDKKYSILKYPPATETGSYLANYLKIKNLIIYNKESDFINIVNKNFDVILPAFYPLKKKKIIVPVISYLYDLQFKYFPEFFSDKEIKSQNQHLKRHISFSENIIVNALEVKKDIESFYRPVNYIHVLPFTPMFDLELFNQITPYDVLKERYNLEDKPYFLISNQFWKHKGHKTAFEALSLVVKQSRDCNIVCTGRFPDSKNREYCESLQRFIDELSLNNNIKFVGFIEKPDQLGLMLKSQALLQPTQFEGGPGGFSVYEALAYGHPCIISDIAVNKEIIDNKLVSFFKVNNSIDLANSMNYHLTKKKINVDVTELEKNFSEKKQLLIEFWRRLIDSVLAKSNDQLS